MQKIIELKNGVARMESWRLSEPANFELAAGEHIAILGPNGSGKTMLVNMLTGAHPCIGDTPRYDFSPSRKPLVSDNIRYISFRDTYGTADGSYYLQQRWNQHDIDPETPTVGELLDRQMVISGGCDEQWRQQLFRLFRLDDLLDKYIITLSSGELRKYHLALALLADPRVLIIDNPFIGLDSNARQQLSDLLAALTNERPVQIVLVVSRKSDIPAFITHVVEVSGMVVRSKTPKIAGLEEKAEEIIALDHVSIRYGERTILNDLSWRVRRGQRWALLGENGSGKSTLLSLICADNPQGYACNITLFGQRRGTGESIWEIKRHIGYVSPEMHRSYRCDLPAIHIVASGLKDSVGLYAKPSPSEYAQCRHWLDVFGIGDQADTSFLRLSSGQQRLVLLARAFVKEPDLLILDEPFHGLDDENRLRVTDIINQAMQDKRRTLIMVTHYEEELPHCVSHRLYLKRNA